MLPLHKGLFYLQSINRRISTNLSLMRVKKYSATIGKQRHTNDNYSALLLLSRSIFNNPVAEPVSQPPLFISS